MLGFNGNSNRSVFFQIAHLNSTACKLIGNQIDLFPLVGITLD